MVQDWQEDDDGNGIRIEQEIIWDPMVAHHRSL